MQGAKSIPSVGRLCSLTAFYPLWGYGSDIRGIDMVDSSNDAYSAQHLDNAALRERVRQLMNSASDSAEQLYRAAVRPIYWVTADDKPDQLGSAVLIKINNVSCLLTAAHVIDKNQRHHSTLAVMINWFR